MPKSGDIVQLRSGGPRMTVNRTNVYVDNTFGNVECVWFDFDGIVLHKGYFGNNSLLVIKPLKNTTIVTTVKTVETTTETS